jgi:hypothetical protein
MIKQIQKEVGDRQEERAKKRKKNKRPRKENAKR